MSFADEQNKILSEINTLIQDSPATAKQTADNISIQPNDNADVFNTVLQTLEQNKQKEIESQPKEIGLGGVFALGDLKAQAKLAASNEPIDKSIGVDIPATSEATQKIATNRVLGVGGPSDYMQRIEPLETETMGAASSGTNDGDLDVANLRAGNAGLNVSTESTLNPFDGSEGNPAFFGGRYPLLQTTVAPFKVTFPDYNLEVMSETLDPEKLAYQAATMIGGRQMPTYIGYTNSGFDLTESWYSGLAKGIANTPINLADLGVKAGTFYTAADLYARAYFEYGLSKYLFGDNPNDAEKKLAKRLSDINYIIDDTVEDWNKVVSAYKSKFGSELTEYADWSTKLFEGVPAVLAQMGAIYGISTLASQAVVSPKAASLLTSTIAGTTFGFAQGADTFAGLEGAAINPARRMARATASAGASAVLNSLGAWTVFGNKVSAGRQFIKDYAKRLRVAAGKGVLGMLGEGATETADQILQDYFTYNMGDDTFANRLDTYTMSFVLGAVGGLAGVPGHISAEKMQIFKELVLAGKVAADAPDFVKELDLAVNKMYEAGFDKEFAWDVIVGMASPEGQAYLKKKQTDTLMGMLDRLSPEAIQYAKDLGAKESARFMNELAQLDQQVYKNLPNELDDSTKTMVSRAMRDIASVVTYYGGKFTIPKFVIRNDAPMEYDPKKNIIYINSVATGEAIDIGMVQDKKMRLLDPMQRGLLHELGHMMDYQLGRGTNYKDFMPAYFEAIAKVYGKDKAQNIQKQMNKTGDRFAFATSIKKADVKEKQQDAATGRISEKNTAEYFAYALGRLGKKVGRALGMADSEVAQHVDAINIMASTLKIPSIQKQLSRYQKAMGDLVKKNDATLKAMAKAQGLDELARHIQDFVAGDENALSKEDVLNLYNILKTYSGVDGAAILDEVFKNSKQETFMQRTEREFADSIKESDITIGDVQGKINELNKKATTAEKKQDTISGEDLPTFFDETGVNEGVFDVSSLFGNKKQKYVSTLEKRTAEKPDGYNYTDDVKAVTGIMAEAGKAPRWFTKFFANGDVTMGLWAMGGKKLVEHFDLIGRMNRSSNVAMDHMLDFDSKLKQIMGFKSNIERDAFENQAAINSIDVDYTVDPLTDEIISTKISPLVAMNLYNTAKNSKTRAKVLNTFGGNSMEMERVLNSLTEEQRKYADAMSQYIKDNWSVYKKSYEQEGIEISDEPYWPVADAVHTALGDRKINSSYARKEDPRGAISLDVDAREVFNHYVQRVAGAKENVYSTIQRIKDLFGYEKSSNTDNPTDEVRKLSDDMWNESKKIRGLAVRNLGDEGRYNRFLSLLDDFLEKRESSMVGTESLNIAARNLTAGLLQWKPIQFMKNLANAAGFWGLAENQAQYWSDTAWAATHPIEAAKYMFEKVPYIRNRFKGQNIDEALTQQTAGTDSLVMNWAKNSQKLSAGGQQIVSNLVALTQASRRLGYTPMLSGDMAANVIGGYGLLRQYEAQYGDKAGDKLSEAIVMHQASNNQALRSLLQRQWSRDIRGEVLRFGSEGVQKGKSIGLAIAQGVKGERPWGNVSKEILSTMSSMILFALISAGVIDLFDGDEENDKEVYEALTREGISAVAGFSVVGNSIIAPILSIPFTGEMSTIGTPLTNMLSADLKKLNKGDWEDLVVDGIAATVPITGLDNLINLGKGGYRSATAQSEEDFAAGLYQLMGRSESYANKRAGTDKETIENSDEE